MFARCRRVPISWAVTLVPRTRARITSAREIREDLVKARSQDAYVAIEKGMIDIEKALMPEKPDVAQATALVNDVMNKYSEIVAQIAKEARASK